MRFSLLALGFACALWMPRARAESFVNWETPHVHPIDITPDHSTVVAVNTPDARLEVFSVLPDGTLARTASIPVGLDPVSVRIRSNTEAWVINRISDSISIVDLPTRRVIATVTTGDEPADVVFAGIASPRAFVTISGENAVWVFDPTDLAAAHQVIPITGEDPRALAVSPDGSTVYAAIFESGNDTTILGGGSSMNNGFPPNIVNYFGSPYASYNPPPNAGEDFIPPIATPDPPRVGLIVRKNELGEWRDDNTGDWTTFVSGPESFRSGRVQGWDLADHDVAVIDADTLAVTYITGMMHLCMAVAVNPATGEVAVVGTDASNEIRYEPNLTGRFLRVELALGDPPTVVDLNPHLSYTPGPSFTPIAQSERDKSVGDPRALAWSADGTRCYIAGMGSDNLIVVDASGARTGLTDTILVGQGPTGIALNEDAGVAYILNKFDSTVSTIDLGSESEIDATPFYDPSPPVIRLGRRHLYNTHRTSGLGQLSCASCHIDARTDRLAWDLGDPTAPLIPFNQNCLDEECTNWHPMKGPMLTQTLQDIIGKEGFHWRGDRTGIEGFNPAYESLLGDDEQLSPTEMQELKDYLATIHIPPNPLRNKDNSLPTNLPLPGHATTGRFAPAGNQLPNGNAASGLALFRTGLLFGANTSCVTCHTLPTGHGPDGTFVTGTWVPAPIGPNGERHLGIVSRISVTNVTMKVPSLRTLGERRGFNMRTTQNTAGFGFMHDGSVDTLERFMSQPAFHVTSDQQIADLVAFMLTFSGSDLPQGSTSTPTEPLGVASKDTHAAVGMQITVVDGAAIPPAQDALLTQMLALADSGKVGLVVKGMQSGIARGYAYTGAGSFQSDRASETRTTAALRAAASPGSELTWTIVPAGSQSRIGIDRDLDTFLDRDELDAGSDPADASSTPAPACAGDINHDSRTNVADFNILASHFASPVAPHTNGDLTGDGFVNVSDFNILASDFGCGMP